MRRSVVLIVSSICAVSALLTATTRAVGDTRVAPGCASRGHTVVANDKARVFWNRGRVRTLGTHQVLRARVYFGCIRHKRGAFRLRFMPRIGGSALVTTTDDYESVGRPRLNGTFFALEVAYFDNLEEDVAVWNLRTHRNIYYNGFDEGLDPPDIEVSSRGGLAWVNDDNGAVFKVDRLGQARIGKADPCRVDEWCGSTLSVDDTTLSWRTNGSSQSFTLRGPARNY